MYIDTPIDGSLEQVGDRVRKALRSREGNEALIKATGGRGEVGYVEVVATMPDYVVARADIGPKVPANGIAKLSDGGAPRYFTVGYATLDDKVVLGAAREVRLKTEIEPVGEDGDEDEEEQKLTGVGLAEAYLGCKRLRAQLEAKGVANPAGLAAAIGRAKYGTGRFQKAAAEGKKLKPRAKTEQRVEGHMEITEAERVNVRRLLQEAMDDKQRRAMFAKMRRGGGGGLLKSPGVKAALAATGKKAALQKAQGIKKLTPAKKLAVSAIMAKNRANALAAVKGKKVLGKPGAISSVTIGGKTVYRVTGSPLMYASATKARMASAKFGNTNRAAKKAPTKPTGVAKTITNARKTQVKTTKAAAVAKAAAPTKKSAVPKAKLAANLKTSKLKVAVAVAKLKATAGKSPVKKLNTGALKAAAVASKAKKAPKKEGLLKLRTKTPRAPTYDAGRDSTKANNADAKTRAALKLSSKPGAAKNTIKVNKSVAAKAARGVGSYANLAKAINSERTSNPSGVKVMRAVDKLKAIGKKNAYKATEPLAGIKKVGGGFQNKWSSKIYSTQAKARAASDAAASKMIAKLRAGTKDMAAAKAAKASETYAASSKAAKVKAMRPSKEAQAKAEGQATPGKPGPKGVKNFNVQQTNIAHKAKKLYAAAKGRQSVQAGKSTHFQSARLNRGDLKAARELDKTGAHPVANQSQQDKAAATGSKRGFTMNQRMLAQSAKKLYSSAKAGAVKKSSTKVKAAIKKLKNPSFRKAAYEARVKKPKKAE